MSVKFTDTQLIILSAAAQRDDRCLVAPPKLKGGAVHKFAARLLAAGLAKEIKAKPGMPAWRRDEGAGQSYVLKLTAAGLKAIAIDEREAGPDAEAMLVVVTDMRSSMVDCVPAQRDRDAMFPGLCFRGCAPWAPQLPWQPRAASPM